jgi:hypothetical protein
VHWTSDIVIVSVAKKQETGYVLVVVLVLVLVLSKKYGILESGGALGLEKSYCSLGCI